MLSPRSKLIPIDPSAVPALVAETNILQSSQLAAVTVLVYDIGTYTY